MKPTIKLLLQLPIISVYVTLIIMDAYMKTSTKLIWGFVIVATYFHFKDGTPTNAVAETESVKLTDQEKQDAQDFAQALIQRDYTCNEVTAFSNANFSGYVEIGCDDRQLFKVSKNASGRWIVEPQ
mgnify:CR=1 FL=1